MHQGEPRVAYTCRARAIVSVYSSLPLLASPMGKTTSTQTVFAFQTVRATPFSGLGTELKDAPVVFEGEAEDVAAGSYVAHERSGLTYAWRYRLVTFYTSQSGQLPGALPKRCDWVQERSL